MDDRTNNLLYLLSKQSLDKQVVSHVESRVWQRIATIRQEQPIGILETIISMLFPSQHRMVPVICAALIGIIIGTGSMNAKIQHTSASKALNLQVFKHENKFVTLLASAEDN